MDTKLELLTQIARGISAHFGNNCEVVIHDLRKEDLDSSIVYIENGHVSNRKLGDGPSEIVLETLKKNPDLLKDRLSYLTRTDDGRILKSSTIYIRGKDNTIDHILALNYDITGLLTIDNSLKSLLSTAETEDDEKQPRRITHNVNDLLDELIEQSVALVGKPVALMSKDDKVAAIQYLNDAGAFLITRSGDKVSNYFGISKFTLYSYMDTNKEK